MFLLFSFIDLLRGVAILDNNHMVVAGNIIVRSMFELLIDFLYCETDRKNLYLRFGEYQDINRVLLYNSVSSDIQEKVDKDKYENVTLKNYNLFLEKYNINTCIYGHLHGQASENAFEGEFNNVRYIMVSCDYTKFKLVRI